ncbi:carbohydrate ABC transporter permease [bacterium]|nr:MAG: carbohydrate ABC transporter permease [bacterium]
MRRHPLATALLYAVLVLGALAFMGPLVWTLVTALKPEAEIASDPTRLLPKRPTLENFGGAWRALPFADFVFNTVFVTLVATFGTVLSASLVAYGFARFQFRGRNLLFTVLLATMMLPGQVTMVPVFMVWRSLGAIDTFVPLTLPAFLGGGAFNVFLLRQFFLTIPRELDEAMLLDGASYFAIWRRLILPLSTPALATVVIFSFIGNWDNFDGPLIYLNSTENYTVSIGLRLFQDTFGTNLGQLMAASLLQLAPIFGLFLLTQKHFVKGIAATGLGGK